MLIDVKEYSRSLKKLWADIFGDDEEYINLLFDFKYTPAECFAEISEGEVVSVLYLLKGYIITGGKVFEGRYLYAAATSVKHRGKGIMAKLIKESQEYVKGKGLSFICLVPADEGLYGYYARFGFKAVMKNYVSAAEGIARVSKKDTVDFTECLGMRSNLSVPYFHFAENEWEYAFSCLGYAGFSIMKNSEDSYYIIDKDKREVLEYVSSEKKLIENTGILLSNLSAGTTIVSPYDLSDFCECKENRFGMVYFADDVLNGETNNGIYMNIALD